MDARFEEIYLKINLTLLVEVKRGVVVTFHEIARFSLEEFDEFRDQAEQYLFDRFGGGNFKLNFYEGPSFITTVNFKPKGKPKWEQLIKQINRQDAKDAKKDIKL
jgi:hypothetical protein